MNATRWSHGAVWLLILALNSEAAMPPRKDINPAILYLHAFAQFPALADAESQLLGSDQSGDVTDEERELARRFDSPFRKILRARTCSATADWGSDPADGPKALLPNYQHIRTALNAGLLRARVALADSDQARARDELLAVSVMSRHGASGSWLVGTMVQVSAEMKILDFVAAHFEQLKPQTRAEITAGLRGPPRRATVADAILCEQAGFCDWIIDQLEPAPGKKPDDAATLEKFRALMEQVVNETDMADNIIAASGGTAAGLIRYIKAVEPHYRRAQAVARASGEQLERAGAEFGKEISATTNLLARAGIPNVVRARAKEVEMETRLGRLPHAAP